MPKDYNSLPKIFDYAMYFRELKDKPSIFPKGPDKNEVANPLLKNDYKYQFQKQFIMFNKDKFKVEPPNVKDETDLYL